MLQHDRFTVPPLAIALVCLLLAAGRSSAQDLASAGPFAPGWRTVTITRPGGSTFTARLFYPAATAGQNAAVVSVAAASQLGLERFPAVSFGHGFLQAVSQYQSTCEHLATWGMLVIAPESEGGLTPNHGSFALDLRHALTYLEQRDAEPSEDLYQRIATDRFALSGHSMGGGASMLAAAQDGRVRIVANLAAAETSPSAVAASAAIRCPVFLITGSQDTITPPASHGNLMYAALVAPRQQPVIVGGFHCGFTDAGFLFCDSGSISRTEQLSRTRRLLTAILLYHLQSPLAGDAARWTLIWGPERPASVGVTVTNTDARSSLTASNTVFLLPPGASRVLNVTLTSSLAEPATFLVEAQPDTGAATAWAVTLPGSAGPILPGVSVDVEILIRAPGMNAWQEPLGLLVSANPLETQPAHARSYLAIQLSHPDCPADWNTDGSLNVPDIFSFLAAWFDGAADFDGSGQTDVPDIFAYLAAWFAGGCA